MRLLRRVRSRNRRVADQRFALLSNVNDRSAHSYSRDPETQLQSDRTCISTEREIICSYIDTQATSENFQGEVVPVEFLCPITMQAMRVAVVASDGHTYERSAIQAWLKRSQSSPMTRARVDPEVLKRAFDLEHLMCQWVSQHVDRCLHVKVHSTLVRI